MIWCEPWKHDECYFCVVNIIGVNRRNHSKGIYPSFLQPAIRTVANFSDNQFHIPNSVHSLQHLKGIQKIVMVMRIFTFITPLNMDHSIIMI